MGSALLGELALYSHQRITLLLQGSGEPLSLLGLLLGLSETRLHILQRHMLAFGMGLRFSKGCILKCELGYHLTQRRDSYWSSPSLPCSTAPSCSDSSAFCSAVVGVAFLLCTTQLSLLFFEAHLCLVHLVAKAFHRWAQVFVLPTRLLQVGVEFGEVGDFVPRVAPQSLPKRIKWKRLR
jgi:hypothetical protein